jgi:hypothetical protein
VKKFDEQQEIFTTVINLIKDGIAIIVKDEYLHLVHDGAGKMLHRDVSDSFQDYDFLEMCPELLGCATVNRISKHAITAELHLTHPMESCQNSVRDTSYRITTGTGGVFSEIAQGWQPKSEIEGERINFRITLSIKIAHEIGDPSLIEEHNLSNTSEALTIWEQALLRLDGIVKNSLQEMCAIPPNISDAKLLELLNFAIEFLTAQLDDAGGRVKIVVKNEIPTVLADFDSDKASIV